MNEKETIAIIGTDIYSKQLYEKSKEAGYRIIAFPFGRDRRSQALADKYYSVQASNVGKVVKVCKKDGLSGNSSGQEN